MPRSNFRIITFGLLGCLVAGCSQSPSLAGTWKTNGGGGVSDVTLVLNADKTMSMTGQISVQNFKFGFDAKGTYTSTADTLTANFTDLNVQSDNPMVSAGFASQKARVLQDMNKQMSVTYTLKGDELTLNSQPVSVYTRSK